MHVQPLGREDPLEKGMATHSSILAWEIPWMEEPRRLQSTGSHSLGYNWVTFTNLTGSSMTRTYWVPASKYDRCFGFVTADWAARFYLKERGRRERRKPGFPQAVWAWTWCDLGLGLGAQAVVPDAPFMPWPLCPSPPPCSELPQPCCLPDSSYSCI